MILFSTPISDPLSIYKLFHIFRIYSHDPLVRLMLLVPLHMEHIILMILWLQENMAALVWSADGLVVVVEFKRTKIPVLLKHSDHYNVVLDMSMLSLSVPIHFG